MVKLWYGNGENKVLLFQPRAHIRRIKNIMLISYISQLPHTLHQISLAKVSKVLKKKLKFVFILTRGSTGTYMDICVVFVITNYHFELSILDPFLF